MLKDQVRLSSTALDYEEDQTDHGVRKQSDAKNKEKEASAKFLPAAHSKLCITVVVSVVLISAGLIVYGICVALASTTQCNNILGKQYNTPFSYSADSIKVSDRNRPLNIVLFGDSLINHPYTYYDLVAKMSAYLPTVTLNVQNYGKDGNHISQMADRVGDMLANTK